MADVTVLIFHRPVDGSESKLVRALADVREKLANRHAEMFRRAGASEVHVELEWLEGLTFGEVLARLAPARGGVIVLSGGAVPLLQARDANLLVATAASSARVALTNNRYSSDVCAIARATALRNLPPLPSDNALPRWLEEHAGYAVSELRARDRLAIDLDTPADIALAALVPRAPRWLRAAAHDAQLRLPRINELRTLVRDPHAELLVFGRSSARTLLWLERNVRCRVRLLAEERGLRASSPLAIKSPAAARKTHFRPRATLGLLLDQRGPSAIGEIVGELGDGAIIDSRVLLAHRLGADESNWPAAEDRFASDLLRVSEVRDTWLRSLTEAAAESRLPVLLGGHSLVGPGIPLLLR
jgi:CTP:molybdopterin cytidylyltransferase MocA